MLHDRRFVALRRSSLAAAIAASCCRRWSLAHAELDTPTPADKATVTEPVAEVIGHVHRALKPDGSSLVVKRRGGGDGRRGRRRSGRRQADGRDADDAARPGAYQVEWTTHLAPTTTSSTRGDLDVHGRRRRRRRRPPRSRRRPRRAPAAPTADAARRRRRPTPVAPPRRPSPSADGSYDGRVASDVILPIIVALHRRSAPGRPTC